MKDPVQTGEITESVVEQAALAWFESLGYQVLSGPTIAPGELFAERLTRPADRLHVAVEAHPWRVDVEEAHLTRPIVSECVHDVWRHEPECSRAEHPVSIVQPQRERTFQDVEAIRMEQVDVRFGSALACGVARIGDNDIVEPDQDLDAPFRPVGDDDWLDHHGVSV